MHICVYPFYHNNVHNTSHILEGLNLIFKLFHGHICPGMIFHDKKSPSHYLHLGSRVVSELSFLILGKLIQWMVSTAMRKTVQPGWAWESLSLFFLYNPEKFCFTWGGFYPLIYGISYNHCYFF